MIKIAYFCMITRSVIEIWITILVYIEQQRLIWFHKRLITGFSKRRWQCINSIYSKFMKIQNNEVLYEIYRLLQRYLHIIDQRSKLEEYLPKEQLL